MMDEFLQAIKSGDLEAVKGEVERNPGILKQRADTGESPLLLAQYYGQSSVVEWIRNSEYAPDLYEACATGDAARVHELLSQNPASLNSYSADGFTPLQLAAYFGHPEIVEALLAMDADVSPASRNSMGVTALHAGIATGNPEARRRIVTALIVQGVDVNAKQEGGFTALQAALQNGDEDLAQLLRDHGAVS